MKYLTSDELTEIVNALNCLNNLTMTNITFGSVPVIDANGETVGDIGWQNGAYVLVTGKR